jgi:multisubunit Na+/H+ antiporter MnhB subunit
MEKKLLKRTMLAWALLALLAIINGSVRNAAYKPAIGDLRAHQLSSVIFVGVVLLVTYLFLRRQEGLGRRALWEIGATWLFATILFEFIFGHYVFGNSWQRLLADYDLSAGRIWTLVLLAMLVAPVLIGKHLDRKHPA